MWALTVFLGLAVFAAHSVWEGYVLMRLWGWFVIPLFALPELSVPQAIGLSLISSTLSHQYVPRKDGDMGFLAYATFAPLILLTSGYVVKRFL